MSPSRRVKWRLDKTTVQTGNNESSERGGNKGYQPRMCRRSRNDNVSSKKDHNNDK